MPRTADQRTDTQKTGSINSNSCRRPGGPHAGCLPRRAPPAPARVVTGPATAGFKKSMVLIVAFNGTICEDYSHAGGTLHCLSVCCADRVAHWPSCPGGTGAKTMCPDQRCTLAVHRTSLRRAAKTRQPSIRQCLGPQREQNCSLDRLARLMHSPPDAKTRQMVLPVALTGNNHDCTNHAQPPA